MSSKLRIALISPKGPLYRRRKGIFKKSLRYMPLTFPTLAALIPDDIQVELKCYDEGIEEINVDSIETDLIGMTVITGTAMRAYELAAEFKKRGKTVILGGPHVTLMPDDAQPHADSIVVGYAEESWPQLLRDFSNKSLQSRYTQSPNLDIGGYPSPKRDVLPKKMYLTDEVFEATRGCIHNCSFCVVPNAWGRKPYQKPIGEIVADIKQKKAKRAIFIDLNLISDKQYAAELFESLIPLNIRWYGLSTTLLCNDIPLLDLAARSGCRGLLMGLESISPATLKSTQKGFNHPENYKGLVEKLHDRGSALQGGFVFGLDNDTPSVFKETAEMAVELGIDLPRFAVVTPFPGTALYYELLEQDRIITKNWELYDGQHVVFEPKNMTVEQLQKGNQFAWKYAYRWKPVLQRVLRNPRQMHVALLANMGYRFYARNLKKFYNCDWVLDPLWPEKAMKEPELPVLHEAG